MNRRDLLAGGAVLTAAATLAQAGSAEARSPGATDVFNVRGYGAVGDGTTDDTAAVKAAIAAALATPSGGTVWFPAGTYRLTDQIELNGPNLDVVGKSLTLQGVGDATVLKVDNKHNWNGLAESNPNPARALFRAEGFERQGSRADLTATADAGYRSVTIPESVAGGANYAPGAVLALEDPTQPVWTTNQRAFELHTVVSRSGNSLQLDSPLLFPYNAGPSKGVCYEVLPVQGLTIRDLAVTGVGGQLDAGHRGVYTLFVRFTRHVTIENVRIFKGSGGIHLANTLDSHITDCTIDGLPWYDGTGIDSYGYGVSLNGACKNIVITGLVGRACRHVFTTLGDSRGGGLNFGGPAYIEVIGGIGEGADTRSDGYSSNAIWDTHDQGTHITFRRCIAQGAGTFTVGGSSKKPGFQIRAKNVTLQDCVARNNDGSGVSVVQDMAENVVIRGGELTDNGVAGIAYNHPDQPSIASITVDGVEIHRNKWVGIHWRGGSRVHITNCYIHDNEGAGLYDQAVAGSKADNVHIVGNIIPKGGAAPYAQPQSINNVSEAGKVAIVANNILRGYSSPSDGITNSVVTKQNNLTGT